jgi:hypothetical protein
MSSVGRGGKGRRVSAEKKRLWNKEMDAYGDDMMKMD